VLEHLVVHALSLDLAALVARLHRAEHATALGSSINERVRILVCSMWIVANSDREGHH
jgi:hypothetical protein